MKITPLHSPRQVNFCSIKANNTVTKSTAKKTKEFFEAASIVGLTSIPMFIYIYLHKLYEDNFKK